MTRDLWDRFMIILMSVVIFFCVQELWNSPAPFSESRYLFATGLAIIVIVLKVRALQKAPAEG